MGKVFKHISKSYSEMSQHELTFESVEVYKLDHSQQHIPSLHKSYLSGNSYFD